MEEVSEILQPLYTDIHKRLEQSRDTIRQNLKANGKVVSGKTSDLFEVENLTLYAPNYYYKLSPTKEPYVLEKGRGEGKIPYGFMTILKNWAKSKGLTFQSEQDLNRWAYFAMLKIKNEGTKQFREKDIRDIYSLEVTKTIEDLRDMMANHAIHYTINLFQSIK